MSDRRLRVVFCIDNLGIGGTELNAVRTAEQLDRSRFDVMLACLQADGPLRQRYADAGIPVVPFPIGSLVGVEALRQGRRFARFLAAHQVDVVHSHDQYDNLFATLWARVARVPLVIGSRRWWHTLAERRHRWASAVGLRLAHRVLANSPAVADSLVQADGVPRAKVVTIPNFLDEAAFAPLAAATRARLLAELGVPPGAPVVGVVARLHPVKDHASLLHALPALAARHPALHLVLVGDGPERAALEEQARALGVGDRVRFAGTRPHLPNLHGLFDLSVLPSRSEGFPNTVIEAMAAGRPVVATRVGGTPDAVVHGTTGLLVPAAEPAALACAIDELLASPARRQAMGQAGRRRAREEYHVSRVMPRIEALYSTVARHAAAGVADGRRAPAPVAPAVGSR